MYKINCAICHGDNGQGELVNTEKILGVLDYRQCMGKRGYMVQN